VHRATEGPRAVDRRADAPAAAYSKQVTAELKALLDAAVDGVIVIDHNGRITTFNAAAERLFGYASAEVIGQPINVLMPEPYRSGHDDYMRHYEHTGKARIIGIGREVAAQRRDGTVFPASLAVGEIPGSDPKRYVGFLRDITSSKAATDALRRERDRAQSYLDLAQVMLVALDAGGSITLINRRGCEILGYAEAELVGRDWYEHCIAEPHRGAARAAHRAMLEADAGREYTEDEVVTRDGDTKLIAWRTTRVRDSQGRPVGLLSSGEDVTHQRRAEQALKRSEQLLRSAQAIARLGNFELSVPEGASFWSQQVYEITGLDPAAGPLAPEAFAERHVHADDRERFRREWQRGIAETGRLDLEYRIVRPDGALRAVHMLAQIVPSSDALSLIVSGTLHDITDRKQVEAEARQGQERLTHVARLSTMGEMATGLAHEINQPLTAIATYAQAAVRLMDAAGGADPAELRGALVQITAQALRAGEVIRRLRGFVKNRAARTETLDMNRLIEDVRVLAEADARASDVRLTLELAPGLPPVGADPVQIQQVLLNFVRNAIDALLETPGAKREVILRTGRNGPDVEVAVIDRAGGIPPEVALQLFNPFFTTKATGTGLGLAISRSIIRAHRGTLGHRPTPGGGTTFHFSLPPLPGGS
jgi:two-component system sensor kinase FixL